MLKWMYDEQYLLTENNYKDYLNKELSFYTLFDYESLNGQVDYENDLYIAALYNHELTGARPVNLLTDGNPPKLSNASLVEDQHNGDLGILCQGKLKCGPENIENISDYLMTSEYIGAKITAANVDQYKYLVFYGKKNTSHGHPSVYIYDRQDDAVAELVRNYSDIDDEWHQYIIDISHLKGDITIIFNGGCNDNTENEDASYTFSEIYLY